jgi:lantibiotic biosynthesis protein
MIDFQPQPFFFLRTPTHPFLGASFEDLPAWLLDKTFLEAIYLSSPGLIDEIKKLQQNQLEPKEAEKLYLSLYRYYLRMRYRCTPFGLFAGISTGSLGTSTNVNLAGLSDYKKNTRLDSHLLSTLAKTISDDATARNTILWFANNTTYTSGNKLRFIESRVNRDQRTHHLSHVDASPYIDKVLTGARNGATLADLAVSLLDPDITREDADAFLEELITSCLLISELEIQVTGKEYHHQLLEKLGKYDTLKQHYEKLLKIITLLGEIDTHGPGVDLARYHEVATILQDLPAAFDKDKIFQSDLVKPVHANTLNKSIADEIQKATTMLHRVSPPAENETLKKFRQEFSKRYENSEIPLLEALDPDCGIGYPALAHASEDNAVLLDGIRAAGHAAPAPSYRIDAWSRYLMERYAHILQQRETTLYITDQDLAPFIPSTTHTGMPDACYTVCSILAPSAEAVDRGDYEIDHQVTAGPSAFNLLGRFCHVDKDIERLARQSLQQEEACRPDAVYAEIIHINQARLGNVLMRPVLRTYEIPILSIPSVGDEHTILLSDLMVSVRDDKILLRSKRLNKEVLPRLTTAHNFSFSTVPHYHFLCDLQGQRLTRAIRWDWGVLQEFPFLPRVQYGKVILARARWAIDIKKLSESNDGKNLDAQLENYLPQSTICRHVTLSQGDNQLPLDLHDRHCLQILLQELKKYKKVIVEECLLHPNNLFVEGPTGKFTNELIIPWQRKPVERRAITPVPMSPAVAPPRMFIPGTAWHYVKIYCGVKTADVLVCDVIQPLTAQLLAESVIDKWFFIRYADPDHHLRVRFHGTGAFPATAMDRLNLALQRYIDNNLIWKIQTDTYRREVERYGPANIEHAESIFFHDSVATAQILSHLEGDAGDDLRWQFAAKGIDDFLNTCTLSLREKKELIAFVSAGFLREFNITTTDEKKLLSNKYREVRKKIEYALTATPSDEDLLYPIWQIFQERVLALEPHCATVMMSVANPTARVELLSSYIHMFLNRFFRSKQRQQEMVLYDLLHQYYRSALAQTGKKSIPGSQLS